MKEALKRWYKFLSPKYQKLFNEYPVEFKPRYGHGKPANENLLEIINSNREEYKKHLNTFLSLKDNIQQIKTSENETDSTQPANAGGKVSQAAKQAKSAKPKLLTIKKK